MWKFQGLKKSFQIWWDVTDVCCLVDFFFAYVSYVLHLEVQKAISRGYYHLPTTRTALGQLSNVGQ